MAPATAELSTPSVEPTTSAMAAIDNLLIHNNGLCGLVDDSMDSNPISVANPHPAQPSPQTAIDQSHTASSSKSSSKSRKCRVDFAAIEARRASE